MVAVGGARPGAGVGTDVSWTMRGALAGATKLLGKVVSMDRVVGKDLENGLSRLKTAAEA